MIGTAEWLVPVLIYIAGWLFTFRRISGQLAWHFLGSWTVHSYQTEPLVPDGPRWTLAMLLGAMFAIAWPISLPIAHGLEGAPSGGTFFYVPRDQRVAIQAKRIEELEKAAGIRDY